MTSSAAIAIFDSGLGGLSVLREIRCLLPHEDLVYVADSRFCPYGVRAEQEIRARTLTIGRYLFETGAKLLVIACNTASSVALEDLRAYVPIPVIGLEPAVKPAVAQTRTGQVAVLATPRTASGDRLARLIANYAGETAVEVAPAPGLVELVEAGQLDGPGVEDILRSLLAPILATGVDTIVLGCTHFPFLRPALERIAGPSVTFVDSGEAIARRTRDLLSDALVGSDAAAGSTRLLTTGDVDRFAELSTNLLQFPLPVEQLAI